MKENIIFIITVLIVFFIIVGIIIFNFSNNSNHANIYSNNPVLSENNVNQETITNNPNEQIDILEKINSATKVKVEEEFISFNKKYNIYIDNSYIGNISGKFINVTGDVFTFKDKNDNIISYEKQIKRWGIKLNRMAELRDKSNNAIRIYW